MKVYKEVIRKYYKRVYQSFSQPTLSSNGTFGGDSFACSQSSILNNDTNSYSGWKAFDKVGASTYWSSGTGFPQYIVWYNNNPLKITKVTITNADQTFAPSINDYQLQYSDDNVNWTTVNSGNGTSGYSVAWDINVTHTTPHRYWRLYVTSAIGDFSYYVAIGEITITATQQVGQESTSSDYDYYEDVDVYKVVKENNVYKAINV